MVFFNHFASSWEPYRCTQKSGWHFWVIRSRNFITQRLGCSLSGDWFWLLKTPEKWKRHPINRVQMVIRGRLPTQLCGNTSNTLHAVSGVGFQELMQLRVQIFKLCSCACNYRIKLCNYARPSWKIWQKNYVRKSSLLYKNYGFYCNNSLVLKYILCNNVNSLWPMSNFCWPATWTCDLWPVTCVSN